MAGVAGRARAARCGVAVGVVLLVSTLGLPVAQADTAHPVASAPAPRATAGNKDGSAALPPAIAGESAVLPPATAAIKDRSPAIPPAISNESAPPAAVESGTTAAVVAAAPAVPPAPAITVAPSTGLVSGASVAVHGTGFAAGQTGVVECRAGVASIADCDLSNVQFVDAAADGAFDTTFNVRRTIRSSSGTVRCSDAPDTCVIAAGNIADQTNGATQPISFDPTVPAPSPSVSLNPDTGLVDGQSVVVSGSGFRPDSFLQITQCAPDALACSNGEPPVTIGASGSFSTTVVVRNRAAGPSGTVSCLEVACALQVVDYGDPEYDVSVPLAFDPNGPPAVVPAITVTPSVGLTDRQVVVVAGTGFDADTDVYVTQCPVPDTGTCAQAQVGYAHTDPSGAFSLEAPVRRIVGRYGPTAIERVDCALAPCEVVVDQFDSTGLRASAAVAFDPAVPPPPPPTITATPTTGLGYREPVTVQGQGFTPGTFVFVAICANSPELGFCLGGPAALVDASGGVTLTVIARRFAGGFPGQAPVDCASAPGTCELQVTSDDQFEQFSVPLTFDPNAPVPPPPTLSVEPATGLGYRQSVTIHASGFAPGDDVYLSQCQPDSQPGSDPCSGFQPATVDANGNVETSLTVRRTLTNGFNLPIDCAAAPGTCVVTIDSQGGGDHAEVPLSFDPNAPIPPPPNLTATPATGLSEGQTVALAGSGFTPNASIGFALCAAGTLSVNRCDISHAGFATADGAGNVTGELAVSSTINTSEGTIDCGAAPGACFVGAANLNDFIENGRAPVSFGPEIAIGSVVVSERYGSAALAAVTVTLSGPSTREVRVHWATVDDSAAAPSDYLAGAGELVFAPGETSKVIWLGIVSDGTRQQDEQFFVDLSVPQAGSIAAAGTRAQLTLTGDGDGDHHHHDGSHHHHGRPDHDGHHQDSGHRFCNRF